MNAPTEAEKLNDAASQAFSSGRYLDAITLYGQAVELARKTRDKQGECAWLGNLGIFDDAESRQGEDPETARRKRGENSGDISARGPLA